MLLCCTPVYRQNRFKYTTKVESQEFGWIPYCIPFFLVRNIFAVIQQAQQLILMQVSVKHRVHDSCAAQETQTWEFNHIKHHGNTNLVQIGLKSLESLGMYCWWSRQRCRECCLGTCKGKMSSSKMQLYQGSPQNEVKQINIITEIITSSQV